MSDRSSWTSPLAIQDQLPGNLCFGCGSDNEKGLKLKSYWKDGESRCEFVPSPQHAAGPPHVVNGGILATIVDCHSICTAIAGAYDEEGRPIGSAPLIWYVTGSLTVDYRRPTPIETPVTLVARVREASGRKSWVDCRALSGATEVATASVLAVRVPDDWRGV